MMSAEYSPISMARMRLEPPGTAVLARRAERTQAVLFFCRLSAQDIAFLRRYPLRRNGNERSTRTLERASTPTVSRSPATRTSSRVPQNVESVATYLAHPTGPVALNREASGGDLHDRRDGRSGRRQS